MNFRYGFLTTVILTFCISEAWFLDPVILALCISDLVVVRHCHTGFMHFRRVFVSYCYTSLWISDRPTCYLATMILALAFQKIGFQIPLSLFYSFQTSGLSYWHCRFMHLRLVIFSYFYIWDFKFSRRRVSSGMMEAVRTAETSVDNNLHGSISQKTTLNIILFYSLHAITLVVFSYCYTHFMQFRRVVVSHYHSRFMHFRRLFARYSHIRFMHFKRVDISCWHIRFLHFRSVVLSYYFTLFMDFRCLVYATVIPVLCIS
jgi:hypothetical protein